ncbi:Transcriptional regulatory protein, ArsR family protein [Nitrobacter sp. Nb-311A]|uniref:ArsR/SmtB family transcription factor n=1 Tax=unclassified Nitrobacter TaxID=2620411 RepID=UPI0000685E41|nr:MULTISPECIES: metalloregulator ArsR/SmtB family transcription factor [unclassified Nitrobacter]EAQ35142.1 Transcriptional regulatory protein, ArsR family protein [Nitrobacter sp. Nb-311A]MCB1393908.1 helix-turn-helix transcriptional regulator [Nitrobacter sp.]MCV0387973.1 metalloregulator ArsR/SmtB family transcription factor [Nitrobacter sp.]
MNAIWRSREQADLAADKLRKFAQPQRLMILSLLREGEKSVTEIDVATGIGQPALSQQLAELRKAELVTTRRQAKQIYYSLADESVALCVRSLEAMFNAGDPEQVLLNMTRPSLRSESESTVGGAANFVRLRRSG